MKEKFVIITNQRSGSNLLVSMLNSHPEIKCFGELMRATPRWMKIKGYRGALTILEKVDPAFKSDRHRFANPGEFVQAVFATAPKRRKVIGFKQHLNQHPDFMVELIRNPDWKLVILERENKLAQFSSRKITEVTGQGNAPKGTRIKKATVEFSAREFAKFVEREAKDWERVRAEIAASGKTPFSIRYTDLLSKDPMQRLLEFLDVDPSVDVKPGTEKRNPSAILKRFSNSEDAAAALEEMGRAQWSHEDLHASL
jgi:LPS sulfotransferase NodH